MERFSSGAENQSDSMHQSNSGRYTSSSTGETAERGFTPSSSGGIEGNTSSQSGNGHLPSNLNMQAEAAVQAVTGFFHNVCSKLSEGRKKDREREQQMLAAEDQRHQEKMRNIEDENERANQNRSQIHAARQESYNKADLDIQIKQLEREKREKELSKRKEKERKNNEEALQRERELYDQRLRAAEEKNQQLISDTKTSMEAGHQSFLETKAHMENTHQMEMNMIKGLAGATANLYKDLGYFNNPPEYNENQGARLHEIEAAPTNQQMDNIQPGEAMYEQRPMETSSNPQVLLGNTLSTHHGEAVHEQTPMETPSGSQVLHGDIDAQLLTAVDKSDIATVSRLVKCVDELDPDQLGIAYEIAQEKGNTTITKLIGFAIKKAEHRK